MKKLVLVVDMQNDFIDGALGTKEAQAIVPIMKEKLEQFNKNKNYWFLYTQDTHGKDYLRTQEGKNLPVPHCIKGTKGWEIRKELYFDQKDSVNKPGIFRSGGKLGFNEQKNVYQKDSFGAADLVNLMPFAGVMNDFDEIIIMGVCTDICVVSNALLLKARLPEMLITVDASCCAGVTPEKHKAALETMKSCQINVINE